MASAVLGPRVSPVDFNFKVLLVAINVSNRNKTPREGNRISQTDILSRNIFKDVVTRFLVSLSLGND